MNITIFMMLLKRVVAASNVFKYFLIICFIEFEYAIVGESVAVIFDWIHKTIGSEWFRETSIHKKMN
jgi:hypothetical protein